MRRKLAWSKGESVEPVDSFQSHSLVGLDPRARPSLLHWGIAVVVVPLILYPLARWMEGPVPAPGQSEMETSYQHYLAGRYQDAIISAKAAVAADPNLAGAYNNLAVSYMALNRTDEAIQAVQEAIRLQPDSQLSRNNLAWFQREKSQASLPPIPAAAAAQAAALLNESLQQYQAGRFRECLDTSTRSATLNPRAPGAFINMGICAGNLGLWDVAIRNTEEAIRLDPTSSLARNNLAWIQQQGANSLIRNGR